MEQKRHLAGSEGHEAEGFVEDRLPGPWYSPHRLNVFRVGNQDESKSHIELRRFMGSEAGELLM